MCGTCSHAPIENESPLNDYPPSTERVAELLAAEGPLTQKQLVERTGLASRTVRSAIADLRQAELISERFYLPDLRQRQYVFVGSAGAP